MSNQLVPVNGNTPDDITVEAGRTQVINSVDDVRAGQYWRTKHAIAPLVKRWDEEVTLYYGPEDPEFDHTRSWQQQPKPEKGSRPREKTERQGFEAGYLLLISKVHYALGFLHSVTTAPHPLDPNKTNHTFMLEELLEHFEHVSDAEAQAQRSRELQSLQDNLTTLQQQLLAGPESVQAVGFIGQGPAALPSSKPSLTTLVQNADKLGELQARTDNALALAKETQTHVAEKSKAIARVTETMANFYTERATAMIALTSDVVAHAKNLQLGAEAIGLYAGNDVTVTTICTGEPAPDSEKLTVARHSLAMDEEYFVHLDGKGDENGDSEKGADFKDVEAFIAELATNPKLRDQCLPRQRMITLMRPRRHGRDYGDPFVNLAFNQHNKASFLLVRNGENFHVVRARFLEDRQTLYPTSDSVAHKFSGVDGATISAEDLDLGKNDEKVRDRLKTYKTLLLLLWGLNDREQLFGNFYSNYPEDGFLNPIFQEQNFIFWEQDENAIGVGMPSWNDYAAEQNAKLRSGSRVLALLNNFGKDNMPLLHSSYSYEISENQPNALYWNNKKNAFIGVARRQGTNHFLEVEIVNQFKRRQPPINSKATIPEGKHSAYLVLDGVKAADIDYYLHSRADRPNYANFMSLMFKAREYLRREEEVQAPVLAKIRQALTGEHAPASLRDRQEHEIESAIEETVQLFRAARRGAQITNEDVKPLLSQTIALLTQNDFSGAAEQLAGKLGVTPIRLVQTGRDKYVLYTTSTPDEEENLVYPHRWISRRKLVKTASGFKQDGIRLTLPGIVTSDEKIVHTWEEGVAAEGKLGEPEKFSQDRDAERAKQEQLPLSVICKIKDLVADTSSIDNLLHRPVDFSHSLEKLNRFRRNLPGGHVSSVMMAAPIGISRNIDFGRAGHNEWEIQTKRVMVRAVYIDAYLWHFLHAQDDEERGMVRQAFISSYANKSYALETFQRLVGKGLQEELPTTKKPILNPDGSTGGTEYIYHPAISMRITGIDPVEALKHDYGQFAAEGFHSGLPLRKNWREQNRYVTAAIRPRKLEAGESYYSQRSKEKSEADYHFQSDDGFAMLPAPEKVDALAALFGLDAAKPKLPKQDN